MHATSQGRVHDLLCLVIVLTGALDVKSRSRTIWQDVIIDPGEDRALKDPSRGSRQLLSCHPASPSSGVHERLRHCFFTDTCAGGYAILQHGHSRHRSSKNNWRWCVRYGQAMCTMRTGSRIPDRTTIATPFFRRSAASYQQPPRPR
jgi:hypothetical protein